MGLPEGVARVAEEEKVLGCFTLTTQPGVHSGVGSGGLDFGPARNYEALLDMNQQFDFYNGGGLDVCFLGVGQVGSCTVTASVPRAIKIYDIDNAKERERERERERAREGGRERERERERAGRTHSGGATGVCQGRRQRVAGRGQAQRPRRLH